ncbi:MAG: ABC transporter permease, partial [Clostridia bacterium]|nr:ABC transporter permease [Clostridia bacterium]
IVEIANASSVTGGNYYDNTVNGVLEFSEQEVSSDGNINDFGYKLISGVYPKLTYFENQTIDETSYYNIAISSYLADSLFFYLNGTQLDGIAINKVDDLINKHITIKDMKFKIVGILDCGEIPAKYDKIKTTTIGDVQTRMLVEDFNSYISSGAYKCIFVVDGFKKMYDTLNKRAVLYNSGSLQWSTSQSDIRSGKKADAFVYSVDDYDQDNILLFSGNYEQGKKVTLQDDEVLIHTENLKILYYNQYENELDSSDRIYANTLMTKIQNDFFNLSEKKEFLEELLTLLCPDGNVEKVISATKSSSKTDAKITKNVKVVGIYFGIEPNRITNRLTYRFMMNDNLMEEFGIYTEQGDYSKLIIKVNRNSRGTRYLSDLMTNENGFALNWFGSSAISLIKENEESIKQSANLFLYAALVLALFSVFMFFNYIVTSIVNKRPSIGVLRGLGSGRRDILRMFICESIIIALINATIATVITAVGCIFVNMYINNVMNIAIPFAIFGARQALLIFAVSIVTGIVSSILPIIKIA